VSGKTARRARKNALYDLDMYDVFTDILCEMMVEEGIDYDRCTARQVDDSLRACCNEFRWCGDALIRWVQEEDE
jgi:hypothetical protein